MYVTCPPMVVIVFIRARQARESARYHEKKAIYLATERKKEVQNLSQQLQQTQNAMAAMQQEQTAWRDQQLALMHEEYNRAIKEHAVQPQTENQGAAQLVQQGNDGNDDTEIQMVEQLLQFEREVQQLQNTNEQHVSCWHVIAKCN